MSTTATAPQPTAPRPAVKLRGLLAEIPSVDTLRTAAVRVRDAGYTRWDCHSPFPVHGIDDAMGIRLTRLPIVVFCFGLLGCLTAIGLQWWANATDFADWNHLVPTFLQGYNFKISGKPYWSFPANIPITFELTVLFSALCTGIGMLIANNLPWFHNPIFNCPRFSGVTDDRFFIRIDADDPRFRLADTEALLRAVGATGVERIEEYPSEDKPPAVFTKVAVIMGCAALIPLTFIWMGRNSTSAVPRFHIVQDMDNQEKYKAQQPNLAFADGRAMRPPVGADPDHPLGTTVARGELRADDAFYKGYTSVAYNEKSEPVPNFVTDFPPRVEVTEALIRRGQNRFGIYCAPCHGQAGYGDGVVSNRGLEMDGGWVQASNLHDDERRGRAVGHLFNSITAGIRTMPRYGDQIKEMDRWAIVAYIRALQRSTAGSLNDLPEDKRKLLEQR